MKKQLFSVAGFCINYSHGSDCKLSGLGLTEANPTGRLSFVKLQYQTEQKIIQIIKCE
jgi:hypothetical protein